MVMAGTANLARSNLDFPLSIGPVLEALEEQVVMLRLLSEMAQDPAGVTVSIGREIPTTAWPKHRWWPRPTDLTHRQGRRAGSHPDGLSHHHGCRPGGGPLPFQDPWTVTAPPGSRQRRAVQPYNCEHYD